MLHEAEGILADWPLPTLVLGLAILLWGGHMLVEAAIALAMRLRLSTLLIGLTIVAFGTSAPELAFNLIAALDGNSDLSFGNVVGSNIANIGLVLGIAALVTPLTVHNRIVARELPAMTAATVLMLAFGLLPPHTPSNEGDLMAFARPDGVVFLIGFFLFLWMMYRMSRSDRSVAVTPEVQQSVDAAKSASLVGAIIRLVLGLGLLLGGGKMSEVGAIGVASWLGMSQAVIGLTIVAVATSLPEVATSFIAARKGEADLAIGNVVGSNIFNILLVMGVTATISPVQVPAFGMYDLLAMTGITFLLILLTLSMVRQRLMRLEGTVLLAVYAVYITWTVLR